jgi:hypothetical protein
MNICPVCGFRMRYPARDWHICPCCGTEFGYEDVGRTYEQLRVAWFERGAHWWSPVEPPPVGWNPIEQLNNLAVYQPQVYHTGVVPSYNNSTNFVWAHVSTARRSRRMIPLPSANAVYFPEYR